MSEETRIIEDLDFPQIEINGELVRNNPVPQQEPQYVPPQEQGGNDDSGNDPAPQNTEGQSVEIINLNNVNHPISDAEAQTIITSLDGRLTTAESKIDSAESAISSLGERMTTAESDIDDLENADVSLGNRITANESALSDIQDLIPNQASESNQLADKNFVNSTVGTNTANYISDEGQPFTSVADLEAYSGTVTNNDYAFVTGTDSEGNTYFDRYKATVSGSSVTWAKEYRLNNSSFTAQQWATINSGITQSSLDSKADISYVDSGLAGKATLSDIATAIQNANKPSNIFTGNVDTDAPVGWISYSTSTGGTLPTGYGSLITVVGANAWCYQLAFGTNDTVWFRESINQNPYGAWSQIASTSAISSLLSNADVRSSIVLSGEDTRNVNSPANYYYNYLKDQITNKTKIMCEFKQLSTIGINDDGIYGLLITLIPWTDDSGGNIIQIVFSESAIYYRRSYSLDYRYWWSVWYLVPFMADSSIGTNITWSSSKINEIAVKFPDYSRGVIHTGGTWTATEDCYVTMSVVSLTGHHYTMYINNVDVTDKDDSGGTYISNFYGYAKKGDVLSGNYYYKVFGLR